MRATKLHLLSDRSIKRINEGMTADGGGLYVRRRGDNRVFVFKYSHQNKRKEMGLGSYPSVSLAKARSKAAQARERLGDGLDPKLVLIEPVVSESADIPEAVITFRQAMDRYLQLRSGEWSNVKHAKQWESSLNNYVGDLMGMPVDQINTRQVANCLIPVWQSKQETAARVRQRVERILSACIALEERSGPNPAMLKDNLDHILGKQIRVVRHHAAVPVEDAPEAFAKLWAKRESGIGAQGAIIIALTSLRSGELRHMQWSDVAENTITIPAKRMKARRIHRIPVAPILADLLGHLTRWEHSALILPSASGSAMSDMTISKAMKNAGLGQYTPHGWRSTFSDWAHGEGWNHRWVEDALAHTIGSDVERAYRRRDYLEQRRDLMQSWCDYLTAGIDGSEVK